VGDEPEVVVREANADDVVHAEAASALIAQASSDFDIAQREPAWLAKKITGGRAAVALEGNELVGFGYWSEWEDGRFISHSGLVVRPDYRGKGLARRIKTILFESSRRALPHAAIMSLTTSPAIKRMNETLGLVVVPIERLTQDPAFWEGCKACRNYAEVQARGEKCCCEAMLFDPG